VMDMDCVFCELGFELSCIIQSNVRTALFWAITQLVVLLPYRRFGTTYSSPSSGVLLLLGILTLEDGTDRLSRNVDKELAPHAL